MVKILVQKFGKNIKLPAYKTSGPSGMDLVAYTKSKITIYPGKISIIPAGIAVAIPKNYEIATSMSRQGNTLSVKGYDILAESPIICSDSLKHETYEIDGITCPPDPPELITIFFFI